MTATRPDPRFRPRCPICEAFVKITGNVWRCNRCRSTGDAGDAIPTKEDKS